MMKRLFLAATILVFCAPGCILAQGMSIQYLPEEETAHCLRVYWRGTGSPAQVLIGVRDKDRDYGPYKRLEVIRFNRGQFQRPVILPASQPTNGPEVLADFSPSGILWFANPAPGNRLRMNKVTGSDVADHEIQLGEPESSSDLVLSSLRAVSDTEIWLCGRRAAAGVLIKLSGLTAAPNVLHAVLPFGLMKALALSKDVLLLAGADTGFGGSKALAPNTHLALAGPGLKPRAQAVPIEGWLQDIAAITPNHIAILTSRHQPGELALHILTKSLESSKSTALLKDRSFTGRAILNSYKDFVVVYSSNLGKCSVTVVEATSGRVIKREPIAVGQDRCIDLKVAEAGNEVLLATTFWRLQGNGFRLGVHATSRSLDDIVANTR